MPAAARLSSAEGLSPEILDEYAGMHNTHENLFWIHRSGGPVLVVAATKIVELLVELGHEVLTRHLIREDAWQADRSISLQEVYQRDMTWLKQCDLFVAEVSGSSFGSGFETGYLLGATTKKVTLFYRRDVEKKISLMITGIMHPNCSLVPYSHVDEVEDWIKGNLV